jgi:tRNA(Ile2) C34 agmatinyltransferase TiaS
VISKSDTTPICPKCGEKLLYDGKGLSCISCPYVRRRANTVHVEPKKKLPRQKP